MVESERYDCPHALVGYVTTFPSLQCEKRACTGAITITNRMNFCSSCESYFENAQAADQLGIDKPVGRSSEVDDGSQPVALASPGWGETD